MGITRLGVSGYSQLNYGDFSGKAPSTVINASVQALALTENQASIVFDVDIQASAQALTLSANQADVTLGVSVEAGAQSLTLTPNPASIVFDVNVLANTASLSLSELQATILSDKTIATSTAALSLTTYAASVVNLEPPTGGVVYCLKIVNLDSDYAINVIDLSEDYKINTFEVGCEMPQKINFTDLVRGDTRRVAFQAQMDGVAYDISGWTSLTLTMNTEEEPTNTDNQVYQAVGGFVGDGTDGKIFFPRSDSIDAGEYYFDVQGVDDNSEISTIAKGFMVLEQDITKS